MHAVIVFLVLLWHEAAVINLFSSTLPGEDSYIKRMGLLVVWFCYLLVCSTPNVPYQQLLEYLLGYWAKIKYDMMRSYNVMCFFYELVPLRDSFQNFQQAPWSILCGSSPQEYSTRMGHASMPHITAFNSPLCYVRLPRLITTACLKGGKRYNRRKQYSQSYEWSSIRGQMHKKVMSIRFLQ